MTRELSPETKEKRWRKDLAKRKPELGEIVNLILDTRKLRKGVKFSPSDEDQFSHLSSSSLPPTGGIRIVSDF